MVKMLFTEDKEKTGSGYPSIVQINGFMDGWMDGWTDEAKLP